MNNNNNDNPNNNNIKERLNLHVKRRLLNEATSTMPFAATTTTTLMTTNAPALPDGSSNNNIISSPNATKSNIKQQQQKETPKTRRPYQKRIDKNNKNAITPTISAANTGIPLENALENTQGRKRRQKTKQQQPTEAKRNVSATTTSVSASDTMFSSAIRSEDDASHDGIHDFESRSNTRDKDKWPDILGMVLSMKRRELLHDPEVQDFLRHVMDAIKS